MSGLLKLIYVANVYLNLCFLSSEGKDMQVGEANMAEISHCTIHTCVFSFTDFFFLCSTLPKKTSSISYFKEQCRDSSTSTRRILPKVYHEGNVTFIDIICYTKIVQTSVIRSALTGLLFVIVKDQNSRWWWRSAWKTISIPTFRLVSMATE